MDVLIPEKMKVLVDWLAQVEYVRKGIQGDHNIRFQFFLIIRKISALHFILKLLERNSLNYKVQSGL